jgi:hypothetical protein
MHEMADVKRCKVFEKEKRLGPGLIVITRNCAARRCKARQRTFDIWRALVATTWLDVIVDTTHPDGGNRRRKELAPCGLVWCPCRMRLIGQVVGTFSDKISNSMSE